MCKVDGLKQNFPSIGQLCDKGFKVIFEIFYCIINDIQNDKTIFMSHRSENVYTCYISENAYTINIKKNNGHTKCFYSMHDQS